MNIKDKKEHLKLKMAELERFNLKIKQSEIVYKKLRDDKEAEIDQLRNEIADDRDNKIDSIL